MTGIEATLVFATPASSSQERRVAIMRRDAECGVAAAGTKTVWALTAYREQSGDMSLCRPCEENQLCRDHTSQVISEKSLFRSFVKKLQLFYSQRINKLMYEYSQKSVEHKNFNFSLFFSSQNITCHKITTPTGYYENRHC